MRRNPRAAYACLTLIAACSGHRDIAAELVGTAGSSARRNVSISSRAGAPAPAQGTREAFCNGSGDILVAPASSTSSQGCDSQIVPQTFRDAICSCTDVITSGALSTDSFDSSLGPYVPAIPPAPGGSVGTDRILSCTPSIDIGGSLIVGGPTSIVGTIREDLRAGGPLTLPSKLDVMGNAWLADSLSVLGEFRVGGDLRQAVDPARSSVGNIIVNGQDVREPVSFETPCACADGETLDVAMLASAAKARNHNDEAGFDSAALQNLLSDQTVDLPCGRLFVPSISLAAGNLTLKASGRTALFVEADLSVLGTLNLDVAADAELDIFVGANVWIAGLYDVGDQAGRVRLYVGGSIVSIAGGVELFGSLYAPHAQVSLVGAGVIYGSIFAGGLSALSTVAVHYDRSVSSSGESCETPNDR